MQYQFNYRPRHTHALLSSATALLLSGTYQSIVIDGLHVSGIGTAGFVTLSASGTVLTRAGFTTGDGTSMYPLHIDLGEGNGLSTFASGSAGAITVMYHRQPDT